MLIGYSLRPTPLSGPVRDGDDAAAAALVAPGLAVPSLAGEDGGPLGLARLVPMGVPTDGVRLRGLRLRPLGVGAPGQTYTIALGHARLARPPAAGSARAYLIEPLGVATVTLGSSPVSPPGLEAALGAAGLGALAGAPGSGPVVFASAVSFAPSAWYLAQLATLRGAESDIAAINAPSALAGGAELVLADVVGAGAVALAYGSASAAVLGMALAEAYT